MKQCKEFNGFITPNGELIPLEAVDRMCSFLWKSTEDQQLLVEAISGLANECLESRLFDAALAYYTRMCELPDSARECQEVFEAIRRKVRFH
jgi:hypothetical protein